MLALLLQASLALSPVPGTANDSLDPTRHSWTQPVPSPLVLVLGIVTGPSRQSRSRHAYIRPTMRAAAAEVGGLAYRFVVGQLGLAKHVLQAAPSCVLATLAGSATPADPGWYYIVPHPWRRGRPQYRLRLALLLSTYSTYRSSATSGAATATSASCAVCARGASSISARRAWCGCSPRRASSPTRATLPRRTPTPSWYGEARWVRIRVRRSPLG